MIKKTIKQGLDSWKKRKEALFWNESEREFLEMAPRLTANESREIKLFWKQYIGFTPSEAYYRTIKRFYAFDIGYIPHSVFFPYIIRKLNPIAASDVFANKGTYSVMFKDFNRPNDIIKNINGCFYDSKDNFINEEEAVKKVLQERNDMIVKPSVDSSCGKNIRLYSPGSDVNVRDVFKEYHKDYVFQQKVEQSGQTARFNPTSLNTFRITTLLLNGRFSVLSSALRCGKAGAIVDNAGAGGIIVGVHDDGSLYDYGFRSKNLDRDQYSDMGIRFSGCKIDNYTEIIEFVRQMHYRLPYCSFVGWDIALDSAEQPLLIEVNVRCPGILLEQLCTGPIFGERLQEVLDYVFKNNNK